MSEGEGNVEGSAKEPSKKLVAEWPVDDYTSIPGQVIRNAQLKTGFKWF